jgi:hypothetical protein
MLVQQANGKLPCLMTVLEPARAFSDIREISQIAAPPANMANVSVLPRDSGCSRLVSGPATRGPHHPCHLADDPISMKGCR